MLKVGDRVFVKHYHELGRVVAVRNGSNRVVDIRLDHIIKCEETNMEIETILWGEEDLFYKVVVLCA
jgi:hypothetical protein